MIGLHLVARVQKPMLGVYVVAEWVCKRGGHLRVSKAREITLSLSIIVFVG